MNTENESERQQVIKAFKKLREEKPKTCWRNPTEWELKFGEGAIHYRDFTDSEIGKNKNGELKKWFKAKDDGLIYHRY